MKKFVCGWVAVAAVGVGMAITCGAQQQAPAGATGRAPETPLPAGVASPSAAAPASTFPPVNLKNFTAEAPTKNDVDAFLKALWGYDPNRIWQVQAIQKTPAPGVSKIVVLVVEKNQPGNIRSSVFFTTPDGQHAIADNVMDFGAKPFAATRALLQAQADGPARGANTKELLLVEFGDLQCPNCKDAQTKMDNLVQDFPQARVVFENYPLTEVHPFAMEAALRGECVRRSKGDAAFFTYAQGVYDKQADLTPANGRTTLVAAASHAGVEPDAVSKCMATPAVREVVGAQIKLGTSIGVEQTPTLVVNGHPLPLASLPYEVLKRIVAFQAGEDGIAVRLQPTLSTLPR